MNVFGMVSTKHSARYTPHALASFFDCTPEAARGPFYLIDNGGGLPEDLPSYPGLSVISNESPKSFAANMNAVMEKAADAKADLFFLNNDLIFTRGWIEPLLTGKQAVLSPFSNRERQYIKDLFRCERTLDLEDYLGREEDLAAIVHTHRKTFSGYQLVISLPFFCIKIPHSVYSAVGRLEEAYGRGGAEDNDYCLRCYLAGFQIAYAQSSYILHFNGKSTWAGAETEKETAERCAHFRGEFERRWGKRLLNLIIDFDNSIIGAAPEAAAAAVKGDFASVIRTLAALDGKRL